MKRYRAFLPAVFFAAVTYSGPVRAQTVIDLRTQSKSVDFSSASSTKPFQAGTEFPGTCSIGEFFLRTDQPFGKNLYACSALNTWTVAAVADHTGLSNLDYNSSGHTGFQPALGFTPVNAAALGQPNGVASLGPDGVVPNSQLPAENQSSIRSLTADSGNPGVLITCNGVSCTVGLDSVSAATQGGANNLSSPSNTFTGRYDFPCSNGTAGTLANLLAMFDASGHCAVLSKSGLFPAVGVTAAGGGTSGTARVTFHGPVNCIADTAVYAGHYAVGPTNTDGRCGDSAAKPAAGTQIVGTWLTSGIVGTSQTLLVNLDPNSGNTSGGSGAGSSGVGRTSATVAFGPVPDGACAAQTFTWTGVQTTDTVIPGWPSGLNPGLLANMYVGAADTVAIRLCNLSGYSITPGSLSYNAVLATYNLTGNHTLNFDPIPDGGCQAGSFPLTGATAGEPVVPQWPGTLEAGLIGTMRAPAADTIEVRLCNFSGAAVVPASQSFGVSIAK